MAITGRNAIAITLLVLEIKVPHFDDDGNARDLASDLLQLWPSYFAYIFSLVMIGIPWVQHHYVFKLYERNGHRGSWFVRRVSEKERDLFEEGRGETEDSDSVVPYGEAYGLGG